MSMPKHRLGAATPPAADFVATLRETGTFWPSPRRSASAMHRGIAFGLDSLVWPKIASFARPIGFGIGSKPPNRQANLGNGAFVSSAASVFGGPERAHRQAGLRLTSLSISTFDYQTLAILDPCVPESNRYI